MDSKLDEIKAVLKKYGQEHLLNHYETLDETHKKKLLEEIENIDFELAKNLYESTKKEIKNSKDEITPIDYLDKYKLNDEYKYYENIGKKAIKDGHAFKCILLSEDTYWEKSIVFSGLPIMKINGLNDNYNRLSELTIFGYAEKE